MSTEMDDIFKDLQKAGKNDVDNLIKWMKDSKLIDNTKDQESRVRKMFEDAKNVSDIDLQKFKEVIGKLAIEQKKNFEQLSNQLAEEGPRILKAAAVGLQAFKEALKTK